MKLFSVSEKVFICGIPDIIGNALCSSAVDVLLIAVLERFYPQLELILTEPV